MAVLSGMGKVPKAPPKKPPAPSLRKHVARPATGGRTFPRNVKVGIIRQLFIALERLGADPDLLSIVGSWYDTLDDTEILNLLREYNETGKVLHRPQ